MDNPFLIPERGEGRIQQPSNLQLATVAGVYSDGLSLIPDDQTDPTQKHYKFLASAYPSPAAGDRVVVMKMSGTYVVVGSLGGSSSMPAANTVYAGPTSGSAAAAAFRALVADDIPNLNASKITAGTLPISRGGTGNTGTETETTLSNIATAGTGVTLLDAAFSHWGKLTMLYVHGKTTAAITGPGVLFTVASGKRPV